MGFSCETCFCLPEQFLLHLPIAGCDIGVQISVRPTTFTPKFDIYVEVCFLCISDSCDCETLHSNCP